MESVGRSSNPQVEPASPLPVCCHVPISLDRLESSSAKAVLASGRVLRVTIGTTIGYPPFAAFRILGPLGSSRGTSARALPNHGPIQLFLCLSRGNDVNAAIPLPAGFVFLLADRAFLAITDQAELSRRDTDPDQVLFGGPRTPVAKSDIVLGGAALIAVALDRQFVVGVVFQDVAQLGRIGLEGFHGIGPKRVLVVVEIRIFNFGQQRVNAGAGHRVRIFRRRRSRSGTLRRRGVHGWRRSRFRGNRGRRPWSRRGWWSDRDFLGTSGGQ